MHRRGHIFKDTYKVEKALPGERPAYQVVQLRLGTPLLARVLLDLNREESLSREEAAAQKHQLKRLQDRVRRAALVEHPTISRVFDTFEEDGVHYLVTERSQVMNLARLLETSLKPLDQDIVEGFARQLFDLLAHLHEMEPPYVLGSLRPDTISVDQSGALEVTDWGLFEPTDEAPQTDTYSAPERFGASELDPRADLYSVGAVLYFALTGQALPPLWERITMERAVPVPEELERTVSAEFWSALFSLLELPVEKRPASAKEALRLLSASPQGCEPLKENWHPEQSGLLLADSYPYAPHQSCDWILKMVQAAVVGRARSLSVKQDREACRLEFRLAAPDVPSPRALLDALTTDAPPRTTILAELACGLRIVGESRDFVLTLDDWEQTWTLECRGGQLSSSPGESSGRSGLRLAVEYDNKHRIEQSADELIRLQRRTRLCPLPIQLDGRPLEPGRYTELQSLPEDVVELYLSSASLAATGDSYLTREPERRQPEEIALTAFEPAEDAQVNAHVDVRCYIAPGEGGFHEVCHTGYHFLRRPSRVLWYRRGVMCGWQPLDKEFSLQFDIHLNGDHLNCNNAGLKLETPEWIHAKRIKAIAQLGRILPVTKMKVEEFWESQETDATPKANAVVGFMGAPLLLMFFGHLAGAGLVLLKKAAVAGVLKASAAAGGVAGYTTAGGHTEAVRNTCFKAIEAFESEEL